MLLNQFELSNAVLTAFSICGARPHVVLTISNDEYEHPHLIAKQLSQSLNTTIVRIPQYITEYQIDDYLSSADNTVLFLPYAGHRSKQLLTRLLQLVYSINGVLVIGAHTDDIVELKSFANKIDIIDNTKDIHKLDIHRELIEFLQDQIASSNVDRVVELLRRSGSTESDIFSYVIAGQLLLRGVDLSSQSNTHNISQEHIVTEHSSFTSINERIFDELQIVLKELSKRSEKQRCSIRSQSGRSREGAKQTSSHGVPNRALVGKSRSGMFSLYNTLLAAAPYQRFRRERNQQSTLAYLIEKEDVRRYPYEITPPRLEIVILDSSGSMAGRERIRYAKGLVRSFINRSYQRRSYCSLIVARSQEARVVVKPTRRTSPIIEALKRMPTGGRTPLYDSLEKAADVAEVFKKRYVSGLVNVSVLTDGKDTSEQRCSESLLVRLKRVGLQSVVFDTCASSSVQFANEIGAAHRIIERGKVR